MDRGIVPTISRGFPGRRVATRSRSVGSTCQSEAGCEGCWGAGPGATHDNASSKPRKTTSRIRKCDHRVESNRGNLSCWGTVFLNPEMPGRLQEF